MHTLLCILVVLTHTYYKVCLVTFVCIHVIMSPAGPELFTWGSPSMDTSIDHNHNNRAHNKKTYIIGRKKQLNYIPTQHNNNKPHNPIRSSTAPITQHGNSIHTSSKLRLPDPLIPFYPQFIRKHQSRATITIQSNNNNNNNENIVQVHDIEANKLINSIYRCITSKKYNLFNTDASITLYNSELMKLYVQCNSSIDYIKLYLIEFGTNNQRFTSLNELYNAVHNVQLINHGRRNQLLAELTAHNCNLFVLAKKTVFISHHDIDEMLVELQCEPELVSEYIKQFIVYDIQFYSMQSLIQSIQQYMTCNTPPHQMNDNTANTLKRQLLVESQAINELLIPQPKSVILKITSAPTLLLQQHSTISRAITHISDRHAPTNSVAPDINDTLTYARDYLIDYLIDNVMLLSHTHNTTDPNILYPVECIDQLMIHCQTYYIHSKYDMDDTNKPRSTHMSLIQRVELFNQYKSHNHSIALVYRKNAHQLIQPAIDVCNKLTNQHMTFQSVQLLVEYVITHCQSINTDKHICLQYCYLNPNLPVNITAQLIDDIYDDVCTENAPSILECLQQIVQMNHITINVDELVTRIRSMRGVIQ